MKTTLLILLCSVSLAQSNPIIYNGGAYFQDLNALQNEAIFTPYTTMPSGWSVSRGQYMWTDASKGYSNNYGTYSFSSFAGGPDKSLGLVRGSTGAAYFGAEFLNASDVAITSFTLSYYAEQWRKGAVVSGNQVTPFGYSLGATSLTSGTFTNVAELNMNSLHDGDGTSAAMDGDVASNRLLISATVSGLSWAPNQVLWIRWSGTSYPFDASHAMAVDDVSFSAPVPEPSTFIYAISGLALLSFVRLRLLQDARTELRGRG
jgi:hypothetical protein